jgi:hypothetical protein
MPSINVTVNAGVVAHDVDRTIVDSISRYVRRSGTAGLSWAA